MGGALAVLYGTRIFNNYYHYVFAFPFIVYSFMIKNSNKAYIQLSILVQ